jgi:hypothetical protein
VLSLLPVYVFCSRLHLKRLIIFSLLTVRLLAAILYIRHMTEVNPSEFYFPLSILSIPWILHGLILIFTGWWQVLIIFLTHLDVVSRVRHRTGFINNGRGLHVLFLGLDDDLLVYIVRGFSVVLGEVFWRGIRISLMVCTVRTWFINGLSMFFISRRRKNSLFVFSSF